MATNNILQFCPTDTGTNLLTQVAYAAAGDRTNGNQPGVASAKLVNKALRQSSLMAAGVGQFLADRQSTNVDDTLTPAQIAAMLANSVGFQNIAVYQKISGVQNVSINGGAYTTTGASIFTVPPSGRYLAKVWGGGGGSGGTFAANSGSQGGAGGGYAEVMVTGATAGSTPAVTVGAGGTFGTPNGGSPTAGTAGGTSSVGTVASATGGAGGIAANGGVAAGTATAGQGTTGSTGGLGLSGGSPNTPFVIGAGVVQSMGGAAPMGAPARHAGAQAVSAAGGDGIFPGGGASGSLNQANGGTGGNGLVIILY